MRLARSASPVSAQSLGLQRRLILGKQGIALLAKLPQVNPGEDAGLVHIVESDTHGIISRRLNGQDSDVALARYGHPAAATMRQLTLR